MSAGRTSPRSSSRAWASTMARRPRAGGPRSTTAFPRPATTTSTSWWGWSVRTGARLASTATSRGRSDSRASWSAATASRSWSPARRATRVAATRRAIRHSTRPPPTGRRRCVASAPAAASSSGASARARPRRHRRPTSCGCCGPKDCGSNRGSPRGARTASAATPSPCRRRRGRRPPGTRAGASPATSRCPRSARPRAGKSRRRRTPPPWPSGTRSGASKTTVGKTQLPSRDGAQWEQASRELGALREQLRAIGPDDRAEWARIAGDAAGVLAAWSLENEREPGPLAAAAAALGRSAQLPAWQARTARRVRAPSARGAALLFAAAARPSNGPLGWMVLLEQMANLAKALHDAHAARGDLQRAQEIERAVRGELQEVHATLSREASGVRSTLDPEELRAARPQRAGGRQFTTASPRPATTTFTSSSASSARTAARRE